MLNQVVLIGRLTHDPELRYTAGGGIPVTTFSLAVDRPFTNQQGERETDFIKIVTWRKQAESCANYLKKGSLVGLTGRLQIRSYEDNEGVKRKVTEVVADNVRFLDRGRSSEQKETDNYGNPGAEELDISEDDVPF
ncbi:MAG: single-stranded DNA-binding protein [Bacillota bacterium]